MGNYIRKPAVFNPESEREKRIWNWIESSTNNFKGQNFSAFVRDKLEWCMHNEGQFTPSPAAPAAPQVQPASSESKQGWANLI